MKRFLQTLVSSLIFFQLLLHPVTAAITGDTQPRRTVVDGLPGIFGESNDANRWIQPIKIDPATLGIITFMPQFTSAAVLADGTANPTLTSIQSYLMAYNGATWDRIRSDGAAGNLNVDIQKFAGAAIPTPATLTDAFANPSTTGFSSFNFGFNGTTWDRLQVDGSKFLKVNCVTGCAASSTQVDNTAFTYGVSNETTVGFVSASGLPSTLGVNGQQGAAGMNLNRFVLVEDGRTNKATYSLATGNLASLAGDMFVIPGSGTKTVRITRIGFSGTIPASAFTIQLIKRSSADTSGTSTTPTPVPNDANDAAATSIPLIYSVAPSLGTSVGIVRSWGWTPTTNVYNTQYEWEFGEKGKEIVLRGTAQQLCVNVSTTGANLTFWVEFTEE